MTSLSKFQDSSCEPCSTERLAGALAVVFFGAVVALNTAAVVLTLLAA